VIGRHGLPHCGAVRGFFNVIDEYTRECRAVRVTQRITNQDVLAVLTGLFTRCATIRAAPVQVPLHEIWLGVGLSPQIRVATGLSYSFKWRCVMYSSTDYAARLEIDYPEKLDRFTTFFRLIWLVPIGIILGMVSDAGQTVTNTVVLNEAGEVIRTAQTTAGGLASGLVAATALMIVFRQRYPRWWFDFSRELTHFGARVATYMALLTDQYPSTVEEQSVHLDIDYPDVKTDLNRWLPLVKWLLAIPHYVVLAVLSVGVLLAVILAWFAILLTGEYPRTLFDFNVGVARWYLRVAAYATLMVTDRYPPFSLH